MKDTRKTVRSFVLGSNRLAELVPGLLLAAILAAGAYGLSALAGRLLESARHPFSPVLLSLLLGLLAGNLLPLPAAVAPGIAYGVKKLLRFGIVLMGIRLSIVAFLHIGLVALGLVLACIAAALALAMAGARRMGVSDKLGALIAVGTSICGVSAIVAVSPAFEAREEETAYAIGTITFFGLLATLIYPYFVELLLGLSTAQAGFFLGTSVHDTSQVTASALIYDQLWGGRTAGGLSGADIAIATKLVRNTFMILVIPFLGWRHGHRNARAHHGKSLSVLRYIPFFVLGYVLFGLARTLGDAVLGPAHEGWMAGWKTVQQAAAHAIALAIACVGLQTRLRKLFHLGWRPLFVGLTSALSVGAVSFLLVTLFRRALVF